MSTHTKIITIVFAAAACVVTSYYFGWFGHHLILHKTNFVHLPGWEKDDHKQALEALQKSCLVIAKAKPNKLFSSSMPQAGEIEDWQKICLAVNQVDKNNTLAARKFFEFWFEPYRVYDNFKTNGLFTGYYLPTLKCNLKPTKKYTVPIYAIPEDWVKVDLGTFDDKLKGRILIGQVKGNLLYRYPDRAAIANGAIEKTAKVLAWGDDKIDVAFAHIQGSAIVKLPNKKQFLIGYESTNGYTATMIGRVLVKNKELSPQNNSMQNIRTWLLQHPEKADSILNQNASYIFFRILNTDAPLGSQQVPLTSQRSLAVDKKYIPLGAPIWLDTVIPENDAPQTFAPLHQLMIAQDTGGAITGIIRGDIYWGSGDQAAFIAGHMKSQGSYWILLPRR